MPDAAAENEGNAVADDERDAMPEVLGANESLGEAVAEGMGEEDGVLRAELLACAELLDVAVATLTVAERLTRLDALALTEGVGLALRRGDALELGLEDVLREERLERVELPERLAIDDPENVLELLGDFVDVLLACADALELRVPLEVAERDSRGELLLDREGSEERLDVGVADGDACELVLRIVLAVGGADSQALEEVEPEEDATLLALTVAEETTETEATLEDEGESV